MASPKQDNFRIGGRPKPRGKAPENDKRQDQTNKRKMQNRISQQMLREKTQAHARQLESLASIMKTHDATDMSAQYNALLSAHLNVLEKNRELNEALLRMRKKLLSMSTASAAAADDQIFENMLSTKSRKATKQYSTKRHRDSDEFEEPSKRTLPSGQALPSFDSGLPDKNSNYSENDMTMFYDDDSGLGTLDDMFGTSPCSSQVFTAYQDFHMDMPNNHEPQNPDTSFFKTPYNFAEELQSEDTDSLGATFSAEVLTNFQFTLSDCAPCILLPSIVLQRTQKIEEAAIIYISERLGVTGPGKSLQRPETQEQFDTVRAAIANVDHDSGIASIVSKIGIDMISKLNGFGPYVYGVGANDIMEKILRWRCSPSQANRMNIPEPFRPTPLQFMSFDHSCAIDFVNWPTIRDQLIFKAGKYDLDKIIVDMISNTVIEVPQFRAAINIHDIFITRVFSYSASTYFDQELDNLFKASSEPDADPQDIIRKIMDRIHEAESQESNTTSPVLRQPLQKHPLACKWGLDRIENWKLSKEFALAHPEIDCSSVVSSFPMYSSILIPEL